MLTELKKFLFLYTFQFDIKPREMTNCYIRGTAKSVSQRRSLIAVLSAMMS